MDHKGLDFVYVYWKLFNQVFKDNCIDINLFLSNSGHFFEIKALMDPLNQMTSFPMVWHISKLKKLTENIFT
jgi:hypothetical protein